MRIAQMPPTEGESFCRKEYYVFHRLAFYQPTKQKAASELWQDTAQPFSITSPLPQHHCHPVTSPGEKGKDADVVLQTLFEVFSLCFLLLACVG